MRFVEIRNGKKKFLPLLLLADEQESMIDRYLERGRMHALFDGGLKAICVVTDEGNGVYEIKNLAVVPEFQRRGYGRRMLAFVSSFYGEACRILQVGTGDSPRTVGFYEACGFTRSHRVRNFFTDHYDHPIMECGERLVDMIYFQKRPT